MTQRLALMTALMLVLASPGSPAAAPSAPAANSLAFSVYLPLVGVDRPRVRLAALYYDTETSGEPDEAFRLWNVSDSPINLSGYAVGDGQRQVIFPSLNLPAGGSLWCAGNAAAFSRSFGVTAGCEYAADSDPQVPNLGGQALRFANTGGQALLFNPGANLVDAVVYETGNAQQAGWQGPAVQPYTPSTTFAAEGQILYRKFDWITGAPWPDSDRAADWAQDPDDRLEGQRVQYPGWDVDRFARSVTIHAGGALTVALGPDTLFDTVNDTLTAAQQSIWLESYTFEHPALAETLAAAARRGVQVRVLLEGGPAGGINDQQRYVTQVIEAAGGQVWYMTSDRNEADDRYNNQHAKFIVVDHNRLLVSSENFTLDSMPNDDKSDGTWGRRGSALVVDDPALVTHAMAVFEADLDPVHHLDVFRWNATDPKYGPPPAGFAPSTQSGGAGYALVHPQSLTVQGAYRAQVVQSPETSLLPPAAGGLLGMVGRAGNGDVVLVQQLYERVHWGPSAATPDRAPNPRLLAYVDAARRGAVVRILLDSFFDAASNRQTVDYLNLLAQNEHLDLEARLGNPAGLGLHNKMVLVQAAGQGWVHVGSLNGSEASAKVNRELALQVQSDAVHGYLAEAFWSDWESAR